MLWIVMGKLLLPRSTMFVPIPIGIGHFNRFYRDFSTSKQMNSLLLVMAPNRSGDWVNPNMAVPTAVFIFYIPIYCLVEG